MSHFISPRSPARWAFSVGLLAVSALAAGLSLPAAAQSFPTKPITLILPFPPGGSTDAMARTLSQVASADLGQPIIIMHKPGGGAVTGTASLTVNTPADGYTLALMHNSVIRHPLLQKVSWDPLVDFTYVIGLVNLSTLVVVRADAPWKSIQELLADAKARPGVISYGNVGAASANRIAGQQLASAAGGEFNMVPYKGGADAMTSLLGGHLDVYGDPGVGPVALSGKIRVLATLTDQRLKRFPNVPTVKEVGYDMAVYSPLGLVGPKGMDPAVVTRLQNAFRKAASDPAYHKVLDDYDLQPRLMSSEEYRKYAGEQFARDKVLLSQLGFKPE
jgi:tripartite-type tricarboxylate transporter receptor subunit TctC